jgi:hypothetical protein
MANFSRTLFGSFTFIVIEIHMGFKGIVPENELVNWVE